MTSKPLYVFNETRQCFLSLNVGLADTHFTRLRGLLGRMKLHRDDGLWVAPCQGIHTIGLRFPIDVVYLDARNRVIHLIEHCRPFRIAPIRVRAKSVLELPTRTIFASGTQLGDFLLICAPEEMENLWRRQDTGPPPGKIGAAL
jgi:uncharacterized protein